MYFTLMSPLLPKDTAFNWWPAFQLNQSMREAPTWLPT